MDENSFDEGYDAGWIACILTLKIAFKKRITIENAMKELNPEDVVREVWRLRK